MTTKWTGKYFKESEFFKGKINWLDDEHRHSAEVLTLNVLDVIREHWGSPIKITSGYRTPEHNIKIGGSDHSQHVKGQAADLVPVNGKIKAFHALILKLIKEKKIMTGQVIYYPKKGFVHVSIPFVSPSTHKWVRNDLRIG